MQRRWFRRGRRQGVYGRARVFAALTLALCAVGGIPAATAMADPPTPYLDGIAATLRTTSPGTEGRVWWVSRDNTLSPHWLLQTPNCWGRLSCAQPPPGGASFLHRMTTVIANARHSVDFAELYQLSLTAGGPEGPFLDAMVDGLRAGHRAHPTQEPVVRVMIGKFPAGFYSARAFAHALHARVGPWLKVQSASMRTTVTSWNHSKFLDADGQVAIVGGMNYWTSDYLLTAHPVNDVSMEVAGPAAADVSRYADVLWAWTCDHSSGNFHVDVTLVGLPHCMHHPPTQPPARGGGVSVLVLGHLGNGISVPGEPYHRESSAFSRPPLHGDKCVFFQHDSSETNGSRAYEYRNPGEAAVRDLIARARRSIFISQQDLLSCLPKPAVATEAMFDERLFAILAEKIAAGVPLRIVLSSSGGSGYSNGWVIKDVAETLLKAVEVDARLSPAAARARVCSDLGLAAERNGPAATWADGKAFSNHAKLVAVDGEAFYIGSQNLYPGRLQELGLMVENRAAAAELSAAYLHPLWEWSKGGAQVDPATKRCDV